MHIYFSDHFGVSEDVLDEYGAFNISLVTDLPLFIDPFLLFSSDRSEYQDLHESMIRYLRFLRDKSESGMVSAPLIQAWYCFPEVQQNWLGFCRSGNTGRGLGKKFATALDANLVPCRSPELSHPRSRRLSHGASRGEARPGAARFVATSHGRAMGGRERRGGRRARRSSRAMGGADV